MTTKRTFDQAGLGDEENQAVKRQSGEDQSFSPDDLFGDLGLDVDVDDIQDPHPDQTYLFKAMHSSNQAQARALEDTQLQQDLDPTYLPVSLEGITAHMIPTKPASTVDDGLDPLVERSSASDGASRGNDDQTSLDGGVSASQVTFDNGGPAESNNAPTENPAAAAAANVHIPQEEAPAPPKKRKGRPPGSRNATTRASKKKKTKDDSSEKTDDEKEDRRDASQEMRDNYLKKIPARPLRPGEEEDETEAELSEDDEKSEVEGRKGKKGKRDSSRTTLACDNCKMRKAKCDKGLFGCGKCRESKKTCWVTDPIWLRTERRGAIILMRRKITHLEWWNNCLDQAARALSIRVQDLLEQLRIANITPVPEKPIDIDITKPLMQQTIRYLKQSRRGANTLDEYPAEFNTQGPGDLEDLISSPLEPYPENHPKGHPEYNTQGEPDLEDYVDDGFGDPTPNTIRQMFEQKLARGSRAQVQGPAGSQQNEAMPGHVNNGTRPAHPTGRRPSQQGTIQYPATPPAAAFGGRYAQVNMGQLSKQAGLQQDPTYNAQFNQLPSGQFPPNFPPTTPYLANQPFFALPRGYQQPRPQPQQQQQQQLKQQRHAAQPSTTVPAPPATESSISTRWPRSETSSMQGNNNMFAHAARQVHSSALEDLARYQYQQQQQQQQMANANLPATPKQPTNYETLPQINTPGYSSHYPYEQGNTGQDDAQLAAAAYADLSDPNFERLLTANEYSYYGTDPAIGWSNIPGVSAYPPEDMSLAGVPSSSAGVSQPPTSAATTTATTATASDATSHKRAKRGGGRKKKQQQQQPQQ
ncbi:unnamed protein product [Aspergillus niger]|nr:transcriptional regulator family: Fungal Specific TF [Aspergillus niger]SPB47236.1 unnamed protein product [Aspergillus niger]